MSDYTPTTAEVRDSYRFSNQRPDICGKDFGAEFDRWLAKRDAEVAEKAYAQGVGRTLDVLGTATSPGDGLLTLIGNPYQKAVQSE